VAASIAAIAVYGVGTWAVTPPQQQRLLAEANDERFLLSLNASALYGGVAVGSALGGAILAAAGSVADLCWLAAAIEVAALASVTTAGARRERGNPPRDRPIDEGQERPTDRPLVQR
jgi:predicted MFS family arabinose efflux permease